jgi:hypothetical protein
VTREKDTFFVTTRYGNEPPPRETVCKSICEGMGCVPLTEKAATKYGPEWLAAWEAKGPDLSEDAVKDYRFVRCIVCNGTGKRKAE